MVLLLVDVSRKWQSGKTSLAVAEQCGRFVIEQRADAHFRRPSSVVCFIADRRPLRSVAETLPLVPCLDNYFAKRRLFLPSRLYPDKMACLGIRSGEPLGRRYTGNRGTIRDKSRAVLLQLLDVLPQQVGVGVEQGVAQFSAPATPRPVPTPIHDDESGERHVDDPHFDLGWFVPHGFSSGNRAATCRIKAATNASGRDRYGMRTFLEFLSDLSFRLWLIENYFTFDAGQYNRLFADELGKLQASTPEHRQAIERMRNFNWVGYIAKSLRNAGYRDQREVQERTHDIVVKMLFGGLFRDYDEERHGPLDLRFKRATANAIKNMVEKQKNARRLLPTVPIGQERGDDLPDRTAAGGEEKVIDDFRRLVRNRLGELGIAVLDARLGRAGN